MLSADFIDKVRARAKLAVIASYTQSWTKTGGRLYLKTKTQQQIDGCKRDVLLRVLIDDLGYSPQAGRTPHALLMELVYEALDEGALVRDGSVIRGRFDPEALADNATVRGY